MTDNAILASQCYIIPGLPGRTYSPEDLVRDVAEYFNLPIEMIKAKSPRYRHIVLPRHISMFLLREFYPSITTVLVGDILGGFDHSSVIHATRSVGDLCASDKKIRRDINKLREIIGTKKSQGVIG